MSTNATNPAPVDPRKLMASIAQGALAQQKLKLPSQQTATDTIAQAPAEEAPPEAENNGGYCNILPACITDAFTAICNCMSSFFHWITCYCFASTKITEEQAVSTDAERSSRPVPVADDRIAVPDVTEQTAIPAAPEFDPASPLAPVSRRSPAPAHTDAPATQPAQVQRQAPIPMAPGTSIENLGKIKGALELWSSLEKYNSLEFPCKVLVRIQFTHPRGASESPIQHSFIINVKKFGYVQTYRNPFTSFRETFSKMLTEKTITIKDDSHVNLLFVSAYKNKKGKYNVTSEELRADSASKYALVSARTSQFADKQNLDESSVKQHCNSAYFSPLASGDLDQLL